MKNFFQGLARSITRLVIPICLFILGFYLILFANEGFASLAQIFIAMGCFVIGAFLIAPPIAGLLSGPSGSLFFPKGERENVPMYSRADSLVKRGLFLEAIQEYREISEKHPEEIRPYVEMIRVSVDNLKDLDLAKTLRDKGISLFKGKEGEKILSGMLPDKMVTKEEHDILEAFNEAVKNFRK